MTSSTTMPFPDGNAVVFELAAIGVAAPHPHMDLLLSHYFFSSRSALSSSGISGKRLLGHASAVAVALRVTTMLTLPNSGRCRDSRRACGRRGSLCASIAASGRRFGEGQHRVQIQGQVPAGIVLAVAFDAARFERAA